MTEELSLDIRIFGLRGSISSDRTSHVRLYLLCRSSSTKRALMCDDGSVELQSGIGTELP